MSFLMGGIIGMELALIQDEDWNRMVVLITCRSNQSGPG